MKRIFPCGKVKPWFLKPDYNIIDMIINGPHIPTFIETKDGATTGVTKRTPPHQYIKDDKKLLNMDVRVCAAIGNALPYDILHLFQNCILTEDMIGTLTVAYGGSDEVEGTREKISTGSMDSFFLT